jgi:hypothetical protein
MNDVCLFEPQLFNVEKPDALRLALLSQAGSEAVYAATESVIIQNHIFCDAIAIWKWHLTPHD